MGPPAGADRGAMPRGRGDSNAGGEGVGRGKLGGAAVSEQPVDEFRDRDRRRLTYTLRRAAREWRLFRVDLDNLAAADRRGRDAHVASSPDGHTADWSLLQFHDGYS